MIKCLLSTIKNYKRVMCTYQTLLKILNEYTHLIKTNDIWSDKFVRLPFY